MKDGSVATEQVYIHSKMMIVDDDVLLVGSANINDRSMLGSRDAELAVVVRDETKLASKMAGKTAIVSEMVHNLRKKCFSQIFGLPENKLADPLSEQLWSEIDSVSKVGSTHFRPTHSSIE